MEVRIDGVRYVPMQPYRSNSDATMRSLLIDYRKVSRLTLDQAARKAGISKTYLHELETGASNDPSFAIAVKLSRLYGISLDVLAGTVK
jgi:transcriptional regulator with XRE-family HTH domain